MKETTLIIKNIHDKDGRSETETLPKNELKRMLKEWEKENDVIDMLIENDCIFRNGTKYGIRHTISMDSRSGSISCREHIQNTQDAEEPFYIDTAEWNEAEFNELECIEGADMTAWLSSEEIETFFNTNFPDFFQYNQEKIIETSQNGILLNWYDFSEEIALEFWIEKIMHSDVKEWKENYAKWIMDGSDVNIADPIETFFKESADEN
jgi:hypothetical protein